MKIARFEFKKRRWNLYKIDDDFEEELILREYYMVEEERGENIGMLVEILEPNDYPQDKKQKPLFSVKRKASEDEIEKINRIREEEKSAENHIIEQIKKHNLDMKLIDVEFQFDRNKLIAYFVAEERVDFRELVKSLASIFKTRIELRQIGVRDEAKYVGGIGICGRALCCQKFLKDFGSITLDHVKMQNLTSNLSKLTGLCSRLMCCMNYEANFYSEIEKKFPAPHSEVMIGKNRHKVIKNNYFSQEILLENIDEQKYTKITLEEYNKLIQKPKKKKEKFKFLGRKKKQ